MIKSTLKEDTKKFVDTFTKEFERILSWYANLVEEQAKAQKEVISALGTVIILFGEDNKLYIPPEDLEKTRGLYYVKADVDDKGGVTYSLRMEGEDDSESNS